MTGATGGPGRALAERLARGGAQVALTGGGDRALAALTDELRAGDFEAGGVRRGLAGSLCRCASGQPASALRDRANLAARDVHEVLVEEIRGTGVRVTWTEPSAIDTALWDRFDPEPVPERRRRRPAAEYRDQPARAQQADG